MFRHLALGVTAAGVLALSGCDVKPVKYDQTKPVLRLTVRDNLAKQNTVVPAGNKDAPLQLSPGYDLMLTVAAVDNDGGMGELTVDVFHYQVSCSVKPAGPKAAKPESYNIDHSAAKGSKGPDGKVQSELAYVKFVKAADLDGDFCVTINQNGSTLYPTVDPGGLVQVHAYAKNFDGTQAALADWYLKRP